MKFKNIICRFIGHRWVYDEPIFRTATSQYTVCEYLAGRKKKCLRCGETTTEYYYPYS